jgi:hypothetical protein
MLFPPCRPPGNGGSWGPGSIVDDRDRAFEPSSFAVTAIQHEQSKETDLIDEVDHRDTGVGD